MQSFTLKLKNAQKNLTEYGLGVLRALGIRADRVYGVAGLGGGGVSWLGIEGFRV